MSDARNQLRELPKKLAQDPHTVAITSRGKPVLAVMLWEDYQSLLETLEIMEDKNLVGSIQQSLKDIAEERVTPWDAARSAISE